MSGTSSLSGREDSVRFRFQAARRAILRVVGALAGLSIASISAAQTNFGAVAVGSSANATVTLTIATSGTLNSISVTTQGVPNLDFTNAGGGTCSTGTAYAAQATCTVNVAFSPTAAGMREGAVVLGTSSTVLATVYLEGTGQAPQTSFLPGVVSTVASGFSADFIDVAADAIGNVFVSDLYLAAGVEAVYEETPGAGKYTQTTIVQSALPISLAIDGGGNLLFGNGGGGVDEVPLVGGVYVSWTEIGYIVGGVPGGIAADASGNIFAACGSNCMYVLAAANGQYRFRPSAFDNGLLRFATPYAVAVDGAGNVYIADNNLDGVYTLYKETPASGSYTQTTILTTLVGSSGIAVDGVGNLYVALKGAGNSGTGIYKLSPSGDGYTQTPIGTGHKWGSPGSIAVDGLGNVYVADAPQGSNGLSGVYKIDLADPPALAFAPTRHGATSSDSPKSVTISNLGNEPLTFSAVRYPPNFAEESGVESDCTPSSSLAAGGSCTLTIDFTPEAALTSGSSQVLSGSVSITTNALNGTSTTQQVAVSGSETGSLLASTLDLTETPNRAKYGEKVIFAGTVIPGSIGSPVPTGSVTFYSDGSLLGSAALSSGVATLATSKLAVGKHSITSKYAGDTNYAASASGVLTEVVDKLTPTVRLVPSMNPGKVESSIRFTATVIDTNATEAEGTVAFYAATKLLASAALSKGTAIVPVKLAAGKYTIIARYAGDTDLNAVSSAPLNEVVDRLVPAVKLNSSANPAKAGSTVTFRASVTGSGGAPAGAVLFKSGAQTLGSAKLIDGKAGWSTKELAAGNHSITASYSGSAIYTARTSAPLKENIEK